MLSLFEYFGADCLNQNRFTVIINGKLGEACDWINLGVSVIDPAGSALGVDVPIKVVDIYQLPDEITQKNIPL